MEIDDPKLLPIGPMARRLNVAAEWLRGEAQAGRTPAPPVRCLARNEIGR